MATNREMLLKKDSESIFPSKHSIYGVALTAIDHNCTVIKNGSSNYALSSPVSSLTNMLFKLPTYITMYCYKETSKS